MNLNIASVLLEVGLERKRQDAKWGEQNHRFLESNKGVKFWVENANTRKLKCDDAFNNGQGSWRLILNEEVAEAYEQAALGNDKAFREELIQVAAVAVAMIECLDRKTGNG